MEETVAPEPGPDEVLVAVHAAAITFDELRWDETWSHLPSTPSHEWSGVIAALGGSASSTSGLTVGDEVFGMVAFDRDGAAAEYVVVPSELVAPKPVSLTHVEAAALPLAGLTAQQALVDHGGVGPGDDVLVIGAAGGVGAFAVQLALRLGARVTATTFAKDHEYVAALGAHRIHTPDEPHRAPLATGSYDVVLDTVGGLGMRDAMAFARPGGTYISLQEPAPADRAAELGVTATFFVVTPERESLRQLASEVDSGQLRVTVAAAYPLIEGRAAFESGSGPRRAPGKTVLVVRDRTYTSDDVRD
ncbi:NADP-dependent oxidoreductase [Nocardioides sp. CN2-186]|uniref:NADP-dependent oxidoreductase n=1 Tax=Nocardioides tweenelious TaxID=3156607 RepID=UPI0032B409AB